MEYFNSSTHLSTTTMESDFSSEKTGPNLGKYWNQMNQKVTSCLGSQGNNVKTFFQSFVNSKSKSFSNKNTNTTLDVDEAVNNELDENGLPVTQNWYYYDKQMGHWNVSPDAPEAVRQKHIEKLRAEANRMDPTQVTLPPPPPMMGSPNTNGPNSPPRPGDAATKGLFTPAVTNEGGIPNRVTGPRYSVPDYFNIAPPSPAMESRNPPTAMAMPPPGGIYGSYAGLGQPSAVDSSGATVKAASVETQVRVNPLPPPPPAPYQQSPVAPSMPPFPGGNPIPPGGPLRPPTASFLAASPDGMAWPPPPFPLNPTDGGLANPPGPSLQNGPSTGGYGAGGGLYQYYTAEAPPGNGVW
ncbi:unnamed protein product [Phytomonas sp. Hart1]|nr:unnamed protein product [Phytomonas sp. Hart1]|eukprot:CCW71081.1 unnamed protein product [Phytomonas sp. isolate Hart1]